MTKGIKMGITAVLVSVFLFAMGIFLYGNASVNRFIEECSITGKIAIISCILLCVVGGFFAIISFIVATIFIAIDEYGDKKIYEQHCELSQEIKSKLEKGTEFCVSIANLNDEILSKRLCEKLECTAFFDGNKVYIKLYLPEEVSVETDDMLWFVDNFDF